jgi:type I restriction enzyme M protein
MTVNFSQTAAYIWSLAELVRGDFKQSQYGRVILPFTILRRLECVLEETKDNDVRNWQPPEPIATQEVRVTKRTTDPATEFLPYRTEDGQTRIQCRRDDDPHWPFAVGRAQLLVGNA